MAFYQSLLQYNTTNKETITDLEVHIDYYTLIQSKIDDYFLILIIEEFLDKLHDETTFLKYDLHFRCHKL